MVYYNERIEPTEGDELVSIVKEKEEDTEMQMLTPIMLESMWDIRSPPELNRVLKKDGIKIDDDTVITTESFCDILLPTFETPPRIFPGTFDDDDASEISFDSYGRGEVPSPRNIISKGFVTSYPLQIPSDVRYEGEVRFSMSATPRHIKLQPRFSEHSASIFISKGFIIPDELEVADHALADSISCFDERDGAEECKDDDKSRSSEEGFTFVIGDPFKEDQYWGQYDGHYGSHDFELEDRELVDYALDHHSVQGFDVGPSGQLAHVEFFNAESGASSFWDEVHNFFTSSCFSCTNTWLPQSNNMESSSSFSQYRRGFVPHDYGVASGNTHYFPE